MTTSDELEKDIRKLEEEIVGKNNKLNETVKSIEKEIADIQRKIDDKRRDIMRLHQQELDASKNKAA